MGRRELRQNGFRIISQLFDAIAAQPFLDVVYRGHGDAAWTLTPSVYRGKERGIRNREDLNAWMTAADRFLQPKPRNDIEWLVWAQHYGVPTGLLDWSVSPLIALFFAADDQDRRNGAVISVSKSAFKQWNYLETVNPFAKDRRKPGLIAAATINARALAQDSIMSLHTENFNAELPAKLVNTVFTVRMSEKPAVLEAMSALGLTRDRVYSDISMLVERFKAEHS